MSHSDIHYEMVNATTSASPRFKSLDTYHEDEGSVDPEKNKVLGQFSSVVLNFDESNNEIVTPFPIPSEIPTERSIRMMKNVEKKVRSVSFFLLLCISIIYARFTI
jgi:hypothetical protein